MAPEGAWAPTRAMAAATMTATAAWVMSFLDIDPPTNGCKRGLRPARCRTVVMPREMQTATPMDEVPGLPWSSQFVKKRARRRGHSSAGGERKSPREGAFECAFLKHPLAHPVE